FRRHGIGQAQSWVSFKSENCALLQMAKGSGPRRVGTLVYLNSTPSTPVGISEASPPSHRGLWRRRYLSVTGRTTVLIFSGRVGVNPLQRAVVSRAATRHAQIRNKILGCES